MESQAYGFIHCHSEHSVKDSPLKIKAMVKRAKEMGAKAISLTDHGTCTGWIEFYQECNAQGIKAILGVEAYIHNEQKKREHLILLAKNYKGYQEISHLVTKSHENADCVRIKNKDVYYPVITKEMLTQCVANGNVIVTSACVTGVLSNILLKNHELQRKINKLQAKQLKYNSPKDEKYIKEKQSLAELDNKIMQLSDEKERLEPIAKKVYTKRIKGLESFLNHEDYDLYELKKEELEAEQEESEYAKKDLEIVKEKLAALRKSRTATNAKVKKLEGKQVQYKTLQAEIDMLESEMLSQEALLVKCEKELLWYKSLFGDDFYIEIQYHGMTEEAYSMPLLCELAKKHNVSLVATNDVHIANKDEYNARQFMRSLTFDKWQEAENADKELYMKSDAELKSILSIILKDEYVKEGIENIRTICDSCNLIFPEDKHYPKYIDDNGKIVEDAGKLLRVKTEQGILSRFQSEEFNDSYKKRMLYELEVIISMGFADYLLIVADFINYGKNLAKQKNEFGIGYGVGPGRGSAAGSLVCYLLEITNIDPLKYNLKFERFLNIDRVTMPDIDTDFSTEIRMDVIEYVKKKFGNESVALIRTIQTQAARSSIHNAARLLGDRLHGDAKYFLQLGNDIANMLPKAPNTKIINHVDDIKKEHSSVEATEIITQSLMTESTITGLSVHAAGVIIGDGKPLHNYIPLLFNHDMNQWVVQCNMVESEDINLLKMDFLGLKNLDILTETIRRIKKYTGNTVDLDDLPDDKDVYKHIFSKGRTKSVFQFESEGMRKMLQQFEPDSFEDIILLVAAYRPGPMDSIPNIIKVKKGLETPYYCIPELKDILSTTYGYPIYQEQLMDIFAKCAGFTQGEADIIRRYMSKKKTDKFMESKPKFISGVIEHGASQKDAEQLWETLVKFAEYAFNKSHAAAYAKIAYQTAYLKYHYAKYYMCSVLNNADIDKIPMILYECRELNIAITLPDVNKSLFNFENTKEGILYGLGKIKTVSNQAQSIIDERTQNGYFNSFYDFVSRVTINKSAMEAIIKSGSLDGFREGSRKALLNAVFPLKELIKKKKDEESVYQQLVSIDKKTLNVKEKNSHEKKLMNVTMQLTNTENEIKKFKVDRYLSDNEETLTEECNLLGAYISSHPLDAYKNVYKDSKISLIGDIKNFNSIYVGLIKNLRIAKRKKDGAPMAFFDFEDMTGSIPVCCFTNTYKEFHKFIKEGAVIKIHADLMIEQAYNSDNIIQKLMATKIEKAVPYKNPIFVSIPDLSFESYAYYTLKEYEDENGHPIWLHTQNNGCVCEKKLSVSKKVLDINFENMYINLVFQDF